MTTLIRTDSTTVWGNPRGYIFTPLGQERRLKRLSIKVCERKWLYNLQENFKLAQKHAAICITLNGFINNDIINYINLRKIL